MPPADPFYAVKDDIQQSVREEERREGEKGRMAVKDDVQQSVIGEEKRREGWHVSICERRGETRRRAVKGDILQSLRGEKGGMAVIPWASRASTVPCSHDNGFMITTLPAEGRRGEGMNDGRTEGKKERWLSYPWYPE